MTEVLYDGGGGHGASYEEQVLMVVKDKLSKLGTPSAVCNLVRENEVTYGVHMHRTAAFEPEDT